MRKKALITAAIVSIVIAGCILSTGIVKENKSKTEVNSQPTSMSEQVENPESSATSDIEIIEDETNISDDGLTSSNAGGSSEPVEVEISDDGAATDKPEPYPDKWSLITQPEDSENNEDNAESGVIKDVGNSINIVDETEKTGLPDSVKTELPELTDKDMDEFMQMVEDAGSPNIH